MDSDIIANRRHKGICSHDLVTGKGIIRKSRLLESDITPRDMRESNMIVALGTGLAPFIWMLDRIVENGKPYLLLFSNSFQ